MNNSRTPFLHPPSFDSQSRGFQRIEDQTIHMNVNANAKAHMCACPQKLASVMDIHRQRFSQLQNKFKPKPVVNPPQSTVLSLGSRPKPRQQVRSTLDIQTHFLPTQRSNTAHNRKKPLSPFILHNQEYITLANLSQILRVMPTHETSHFDNIETATVSSTSTSVTTKQRVQQHLQQTATRWWRPSRSSNSHPASTTLYSSVTSTGSQQYTDANIQLQRNLPLLDVLSHSTRQMNISSRNPQRNSMYDESEVSTEIPTANVLTTLVSPAKIISVQSNQQEPLIMQARGMHVHSYAHRPHNNVNFFQQRRLIPQT